MFVAGPRVGDALGETWTGGKVGSFAKASSPNYKNILSCKHTLAIENKSDSPTKWLDLYMVLLLVG